MLPLPRSARLAAWGSAVLRGTADLDAAIRAVTGSDEPHLVESGGEPPALPLREYVTLLEQHEVRGLRLVLPAPGDALGLPGPAEFNTLALEAGECVLVEPAPRARPGEPPGRQMGERPGEQMGTGLVPRVVRFGSTWEPGSLVTWTAVTTSERRGADVGSLAEADRELRQALVGATRALASLDVARWREDAAEQILAIRDGGLARDALPPQAPARVVQVLSSAARIRAIVTLARQDDGAAVSGWEAARRAETLRELGAVARRGVVAAVNAGLEPGAC